MKELHLTEILTFCLNDLQTIFYSFQTLLAAFQLYLIIVANFWSNFLIYWNCIVNKLNNFNVPSFKNQLYNYLIYFLFYIKMLLTMIFSIFEVNKGLKLVLITAPAAKMLFRSYQRQITILFLVLLLIKPIK